MIVTEESFEPQVFPVTGSIIANEQSSRVADIIAAIDRLMLRLLELDIPPDYAIKTTHGVIIVNRLKSVEV
jgi:hypothetical protein